MYIVKRPFRDVNGMVPAGSVVEPAGLKRFKRHMLEGHIVEVNEQNFDRYADFFKKRYGVTIPPLVPAKESAVVSTKAAPAKVSVSVPAKATTK